MKRTGFHGLLLLSIVLTCPVGLRSAEQPGDFVPLFDGKSLAGWEIKSEKDNQADTWVVRDGILTAKPGANWLSSRQMYGDFVLRVEWRVPENGNSGVFLRVPELKPGQHPHVEGIEIQVLDDKGPEYAGKLKEWQYSGSIYGVVAATNSTYKGAGEWNLYEITCQGDRLTVVMNGRKVAECNVAEQDSLKDRPRKGFVGLQNHGTGCEYRKVEIKELRN